MEEPAPMSHHPRPHAAALQTLLLASALGLVACASAPVEPVAPVQTVAVAAPAVVVPLTAPAPASAPELPAQGAAASTPEPAALPPLPIDLALAPPAPTAARAEPENPIVRADLWQRVRIGFGVSDLDNDHVRKWEQYYSSRPEYMQRMMERGGRYLFHIVEELEKRGMPTDLALLPFIESAFNPQAMSSARASGMWQFMPATGKAFELKQNLFRDDRRDVLASTRAALDYLQSLHRMFGDWQLALAAYNWGQGNVQRALARNRQAGLGVDYTSLQMPDETRNYVPKLQAVKNLVQHPADYGVRLPALENHPFFLSVAIERDIDVALAARLSGLSLDDFQQLNPQMNKPVILAAGTPQLLLPYDNANHFVRELPRHRGPLATWTAWVAPRTLKPAEAAKTVGMSEAHLREVNRIPPRMLVRAGSTLLVPRAPHSTQDVTEHVADNATMLLSPEAVPGRKRTVKAGAKGETVASLARRYRVNAAQLARWNGVAPGANFKPGQQVVLMLPAAKARPTTAKAGTAKRGVRPATARTRVAQR
jgi:membrane-bound lytic murein transglycosylase D